MIIWCWLWNCKCIYTVASPSLSLLYHFMWVCQGYYWEDWCHLLDMLNVIICWIPIIVVMLHTWRFFRESMKQPEMSCLCCRCVVDGMHSLCLVEGWCHHFSLCVLQSMTYNMKTTKFELFCSQIWVVQLQNCCVETCRTSKDLNWFTTYLELTMCVAAGYLVTGFKPHHQQILCGHPI
jgi:hypothetical protein